MIRSTGPDGLEIPEHSQDDTKAADDANQKSIEINEKAYLEKLLEQHFLWPA